MNRKETLDRSTPVSAARARRPRALAVDDDPSVILTEEEALRRAGCLVDVARSAEEGLRKIRRLHFDVVVISLDMPAMDGVLEHVRTIDPCLPVLICARSSDLVGAAQAVRQGAYDYVTKPIEISALLIRVGNALEWRRLAQMARDADKHLQERDRCGELVGASVAMRSIYRKIEQVAPSPGAVLILGEPGTGKDLVGREIHRLSPSRKEPFEIVSCAQIRPGQRDPGSLAQGDDRQPESVGWPMLLDPRRRGTLFLDQVDRLSLREQALVADILDRHELERGVAGSDPAPGPRLISASAVDLDRALEEGTFLADLYSHLSDVVIRVPALRDRVDDTQLLSAAILEEECGRLGRPPVRLSPRSLELLTGYDWPGNVTELRAVVQAGLASAPRRVIRPVDLSAVASLREGAGRTSPLEKLERDQIEEALKKTSGNKSRAARLLGIGRGTIYRKLDRMKTNRRRP